MKMNMYMCYVYINKKSIIHFQIKISENFLYETLSVGDAFDAFESRRL